ALSLLAVYGGYFGAGSGVMTLALLLVLVERDLPSANALKNMTNGAITLPAGVLLAFLGPVHWAAAAPLAAGALVGSRLGPALTRALPRAVTRWVVAVLGFGLAAWLWVKPSA
ncbi:MAG: TSUP family transporter, partial [Solirubrobacteraceae bacterium]